MLRFRNRRVRAGLAITGSVVLALLATPPAGAATGAPALPTDVFNGYTFCSTHATAPTYLKTSTGLTIMGVPQHTDPASQPYLTAEYRIWPVGDPGLVTTLTSTAVSTHHEAPVTVPGGVFTEGGTYAWQVRSVAEDSVSGWTAPCYVAADNTAPAKAPVVTSSNYRVDGPNPGGEPIKLTFDAAGAEDVAGFLFTWGSEIPVFTSTIGEYGIPKPTDPYADIPLLVRADRLGGKATVSLQPPVNDFIDTLTVLSLDRSLNMSGRTIFEFPIDSTAPSVVALPPLVQLGTTVPLRLTPDPDVKSRSRVLSYTVNIREGGSTRDIEVKARPDGTAIVPILLTEQTWLKVASRSANGWVSDAPDWYSGHAIETEVHSAVYPKFATPEGKCSGGAGVPGTFTFRPRTPDVVAFTYSINGIPKQTVPTGWAGTARVTWTPEQSGWYNLVVYAKTRDGRDLGRSEYSFCVN